MESANNWWAGPSLPQVLILPTRQHRSLPPLLQGLTHPPPPDSLCFRLSTNGGFPCQPPAAFILQASHFTQNSLRSKPFFVNASRTCTKDFHSKREGSLSSTSISQPSLETDRPDKHLSSASSASLLAPLSSTFLCVKWDNR